MNKIEDIIWKVILAAVLGLIIAFGLNLRASESKFEVYFYNFRTLYISHPFMQLSPGKAKSQKKIHDIVIQDINKAQAKVAIRRKAVISPFLGEIEDFNPTLDVTSEMYDEICKR